MAADTNPEPLITVIVPVRNRAALVTRTLDSIAAQSLRPLRLIIVDNASSDGTTDIREAATTAAFLFYTTILSVANTFL